LGAGLYNAEGEAFIHPLETRDVVSAAIMKECREEKGVWLDSPNIEALHGEGHIEKHLPGMLRMFLNYGIDMRKVPILVYPTLHYQNGGINIEPDASTPKIPNLFVAGEAVGGIHGRNRLMGNSLLDVIVFGRLAGKNAAKKARAVTTGSLGLRHVDEYARALAEKGINTGKTSPMLLPDYVSKSGKEPRH
jgi:succinate dehydrogenase / fumarate reductase flavoprotein subunit